MLPGGEEQCLSRQFLAILKTYGPKTPVITVQLSDRGLANVDASSLKQLALIRGKFSRTMRAQYDIMGPLA